MSFIRRSDGTTIYNGSHVGSRNIKIKSECLDDDIEYKKILNCANGYDQEILSDDDYENILNLWNIYERKEAEFNEKYFTRK